MDKSKADPRKPPIEDLQGQLYQHELGDPDRAEQIDRILDEWGRKASKRKRTRRKKRHLMPALPAHKHLLIAVDPSKVTDRALAYVAELMNGRRDIRVLILHVPQPVPPELLEFGGRENPMEEKTAEAALLNARAGWIEHEQDAAAPMFAHARALLREAGVREEVVETQIMDCNPNESVDSAILDIAHEKHCGTVVVGYAAFSWFHKHLHAHLADVLLQKADGMAIWVVH